MSETHNQMPASIGNKIVSRLLLARAELYHEPTPERLHAFNKASYEAMQEIDRLAGVVERLPVTKDGVPVTLRQNVYLDNSDSQVECRSIAPEIICAGFIKLWLDENHDMLPRGTVRTEQGWEFDINVVGTFSTREAALADSARTRAGGGE